MQPTGFHNKRKAEAEICDSTTKNKKSKAKTIPVRPSQGNVGIGNILGIQIPKRADERPCVAYYEQPDEASAVGASAVPYPSPKAWKNNNNNDTILYY
eukprot:6090195-Heterocapsa_arctica.AAC.1